MYNDRVLLGICRQEERPLRLYRGCNLVLGGKGFFTPQNAGEHAIQSEKGKLSDWVATVTEDSPKWKELVDAPIHAILLNEVKPEEIIQIHEDEVAVHRQIQPVVYGFDHRADSTGNVSEWFLLTRVEPIDQTSRGHPAAVYDVHLRLFLIRRTRAPAHETAFWAFNSMLLETVEPTGLRRSLKGLGPASRLVTGAFHALSSVNVINKANLSIADVACSTSLWLIDVARELPQTNLDGLDICLTQAPHRHWLPSNITLFEWNVFDETVPSELVGKYGLVHVRSLALVLAGKDPKPVIRNIYQLVKPGGHLQWEELDYKSMCVKQIDPAVEAPALEELVKLHYSDGCHDWTLALPQLLNKERFQYTQEEHFDNKHELVRAFHYQHLLTMDKFGLTIIRMGKPEVAAQLFKLVHDATEEHGRGASLSIPRLVVVVVANKPQNH
ncbi:hypothetical protein BBP40_000347 [Aspergillus hancockii]|nr:hypothetical protein BBP40_000347 [Aspergillus hancockii]